MSTEVPTEAPTSRRPADAAVTSLDHLPALADVLAVHGLTGVAEESFENDGWSGALMTRLVRTDGARFVIKRDSAASDWIARATGDPELREARLAHAAPRLPAPARLPHVGVARDGDRIALLMPDLADVLLTWEQAVEVDVLNRVLAALAALHREPWFEQLDAGFPWCDLGLRLNLLTRGAGARYEADGNPVGRRFLEGWDAFDRHAPAAARDLLDRLTNDWSPLRAALERLPSAGLHGDLKLGNVGLEPDGGVPMIDWQMTMVAPIAVELGWFLVSNVAGLPLDPDGVLDRYRTLAGQPDDEAWATQRDLAIIVGLRLRGWRKGLDADTGVILPTGRTATADLAWWAEAAVEAADRRL